MLLPLPIPRLPSFRFSASVRIAGPKGERTLPLDSFFSGPGDTVLLEAGELLTEILTSRSSAIDGISIYQALSKGFLWISPWVGAAVRVVLSSQDGR